MNEITNLALFTNNSMSMPARTINFRAGDKEVKSQAIDNDEFIKQEYEKAKKQAKRDKNLNNAVQVGVLAALCASVGLTAWMFIGKGAPKTEFKKISDKMPSLDSACINPKVKETIERFTKILKIPKDVANHFKASPPRFIIFYGPTGTGKTFSAQLVAKELDAYYGEVQFSDLSSEFIGKTAVNITKKFKEIKKLVNSNPNKQYVMTFNEMDSLLNNVNKLGSNNQHLGQNRTAFLNGIDSVKDCKNLTIIGTTNVKPELGNMDNASIGRAILQEIKLPVLNEAVSSFIFQLSKYGGTENLRKDTEALTKLAQQIVDKQGSNRDIEKIVRTATTDFVIEVGNKPNATSEQITADYIQKVIDKNEVWASGIDDSPVTQKSSDNVLEKLLELLSAKQEPKK